MGSSLITPKRLPSTAKRATQLCPSIGHGSCNKTLRWPTATKPGFDFRHLNWALRRGNKASPVLSPFAALMAHDERVSSQDLNMLRRQCGGVRRRAQGTQRLSSCTLRCLSKLKKRLGLCFSFFLPSGIRPSLPLGCSMLCYFRSLPQFGY